jgi:hypothetical protein
MQGLNDLNDVTLATDDVRIKVGFWFKKFHLPESGSVKRPKPDPENAQK